MIVPTARGCLRLAGALGEAGVRGRLAEGHARELVQDALAERRQPAQVDGEIEGVPATLEVLVELAMHVVDRGRRPQHPATRQPLDALELGVGIRVERDPQQPAIGGGDEQLAEGRLDEVVPRVEHAAAGGGVAKAPVEVGRNAHALFSFRSRRTPVDAACRAASGLESSAAAICS